MKSNGKPQMSDWIVTYRYDVFEAVRATSAEDAAAKVQRHVGHLPGRRNVTITEVEKLP